MKYHSLFALFSISILVIQGCNQDNKIPGDGPTYGRIEISADQTLQPLTDAEINAFEGLYTMARVSPQYKPESEVFPDLLNGKIKVIVATRELTNAELKIFHERKIYPKTVKIAYDAVALITNKNGKDLKITFEQFKDLFRGNKKNPAKAGIKFLPGKSLIVADNKNSSTVRKILEIAGAGNLPQNIFAVNNSREVVSYVSKDKNAIGIIGVNWIVNNSDSSTNNFLNLVKVVAIMPPDTSAGAGDYYLPYQAYIARKFYPLWRNVYLISAEARNGLGSGFIAFAAGEKGQRVVLKSGLVPATMPVRLVEIKDQL